MSDSERRPRRLADLLEIGALPSADHRPVAAVAREPEHLDIWAAANDGNVWSAAWSDASGWSGWFSLGAPPGGFSAGAPVAAVARKPGQFDIWAVANDGGVWSAYWAEASGWSGWFKL